MTLYRFLSLGVFLLIVFLTGVFPTAGQTQTELELIVTWQANTLFPSDYQGKAFPGPRSSITASIEAYQGGKWTDLSRASLTWVLDGKVIGRGEGMQELLFRIPARPAPSLTLKAVVALPDTGTSFNAFSVIPVLGPQVVIAAPFPERRVAPQSRFTLEALPYFWNAQSLGTIFFSWTANATQQRLKGEHTITLTVGAPTNEHERELQVNVLLQNPDEPTEFARDYAQLDIQSP